MVISSHSTMHDRRNEKDWISACVFMSNFLKWKPGLRLCEARRAQTRGLRCKSEGDMWEARWDVEVDEWWWWWYSCYFNNYSHHPMWTFQLSTHTLQLYTQSWTMCQTHIIRMWTRTTHLKPSPFSPVSPLTTAFSLLEIYPINLKYRTIVK